MIHVGAAVFDDYYTSLLLLSQTHDRENHVLT